MGYAWFRKVKAGLVKSDINEYVGNSGELFFNFLSGELRFSDGVTPGGVSLSSPGSYTLPTASTTQLGGVKVDGTTIRIDNQVISGFSGNYNDLTNSPTIATDVSQLTDTTGLLGATGSDGLVITAPSSGQVLVYDELAIAFVNTNINLTGGTTNQVLVKQSTDNYDYRWEDMNIIIPENVYTKLLDNVSANLLYLGEAVPDSLEAAAVWRIQRVVLDASGNVEEVRFADGGLFDQIWNNRATLTYL